MKKVLIIAEAGVNHNGDLETAIKLIDVAAEAGADIVKFQTFKAETLVTSEAPMAEYQKNNIGMNGGSQFNMLKKLELKPEYHHALIEHCRKKNIKFLSTGFDVASLDFLKTLGMGIWKIPSGEITNLPYLERLAATGDPIILSTGMADLVEVRDAVKVLTSKGTPLSKITVLHCNTDYPTKMSDVNLNVMATLGADLGVAVGYSDHTMGIEVPIAAVALGATVIEKHFTLDRNMEGPDHKASLEPHELKAMVTSIRNIEEALGVSQKIPTQSEFKNRAVARKSLVAKVNIKRGEVFSEENLTVLRPGTGISPMRWYEFLGKTAARDYSINELIDE
ncbi:N-acetylneuraminate synthase [Bdellovibrio sp. 22V]|uniref:N-acetylneuraminate synthase n=1 Tax=Bdellovibrio sp. 22V TaxID=3044166 RepID=UPI0032F01DB7